MADRTDAPWPLALLETEEKLNHLMHMGTGVYSMGHVSTHSTCVETSEY